MHMRLPSTRKSSLKVKIRAKSLTSEFKLTANRSFNFFDVGQLLLINRTLDGDKKQLDGRGLDDTRYRL